jgi:hypothetical protein
VKVILEQEAWASALFRSARERLADLEPWLGPFLATLPVIFSLGYSYGEPSHVIFLPWILHLIDPAVLAQDWFVNTTPHHLNSIRFMAWAGRLVPLPAVVLVLHILALLLLLFTMHRISGHLFHDRRVFYAAVFLLLHWGAEGLGGNGLWANYLVQHNAAVPVCLLAFYLVLREKPLAAAVTCAAATWVHIQLGALTMLVLGVGMLPQWRRTGPGPILLAGTLYAAAVFPTLAQQWLLYMAAPSPLDARRYLYIHAIMRHPHHVIPSSWPGSDFYRFFLLVAMGALAGRWRRPPDRTVLTWFAVIMGLCIVGTVFVEWIPLKLVIKLQTFRMTVFVKLFAVLYTAKFLLRTIEEKHVLSRLCTAAILTIQNYGVITASAALIVALRQKQTWRWALAVFAAGLAIGVTAVATASLGVPIPLFWHSFAIGPRLLGLQAALLAALGTVAWFAVRWLPAALLAAVLLARCCAGLPYFGYDHPPIDNWYRFCRRVKAETPQDAIFITPPMGGGFQLFALRAEVADFKCTPLIEKDLLEWKRRLDDLSGSADLRCSGWVECGSDLAGGYYRLREKEFLALAQKYHAQYVVTAEPKQQLSFPELFRVGEFALYRVPP